MRSVQRGKAEYLRNGESIMISVLMPVYNVEKYIENTLESVAGQTYGDFEAVMVDDGSTDSSGAVCDEWAEKDSRFRVIHTPNRGVSAARNTALANVKGEYIFFMDSDDIILPETFEELLNSLLENGADMAAGNMYYTDDKNNPIEKLNSSSPMKNEILTGVEYIKKLTEPNANYYCTSTNKIFKKELFDGIVYPVGRINEDEARIHEVIFKCKKIVTLKKPYYRYIKHSEGITGTSFGIKNLDREDAFRDRINFLLSKNLDELASFAAIAAMDSAIVTFEKCVENGYYYGETKKRLIDDFDFFFKHSPDFSSLGAFHKKVYIIGWVVLHCPDVYAEYVNFFVKKDNMGLGEAVRDESFNFIMKCLELLPTRDRIVFESHPEMSCNAYPVYEYLLEKGLNEKYEFVWLSENKEKYKPLDAKKLRFINYTKSARKLSEKISTMYTIATAKALVYSNQLLGTHGRDRISLCLQHGMPFKSSNGTYCIKNDCTAAVCVSRFFADSYAEDFRLEKDKMIFTGFPRNDYLLKENDSLKKFGFDKYCKVIFWLPTFRQRTAGALNRRVGEFEMSVHGTGIPAIETREDMLRVNDFCRENNCLLILKPHPVQDLSVVSDVKMSNFFIMSDRDLAEKGVQLYSLLGMCDAMITDYSSVYYDFLLTDKPIGLTIGDIDEYAAKRGFVYKNPRDILKGEEIDDTDGLLSFIRNVKDGRDACLDERRKVKNMIHTVTDGTSAQNAGEWLIRQLSE